MEGRPVWLASISIWDPRQGAIIPTSVWRRDRYALDRGEQILREVLNGAGDPTRERLFRMNVTLCLHRGLTDEEERTIGSGCAVHLAGGAVEVLWQRGVRSSPAAMPCERPRRRLLPGGDPRLWLPVDCGGCEPCHARAAIEDAA